ncbi:hypothetical protein Tco_0211402 [Tanacetum coccineum]
MSSLPFYCTPHAAINVAISDPTPEDLAAGTLSTKVLAKAKASKNRKASLSLSCSFEPCCQAYQIFLDYHVTLGFGSTGGLDLACPIIRLSCQYGIHQNTHQVSGTAAEELIRNMEMEPDIENMTISEYFEYEAVKEIRLWDDVRSSRSPTNYNEANVDSFHQNKSKNFSYPYSHNFTPPHPCFLPVQPYLKNYFVSTNGSNDVDEDQEEDGDDGDTFDMWDITAEDVERIRKFFNVPDEIDEIVQPLIPEPIHTTPPNDDYVALATKSILDELLEEFGDEILNVTMVDDEPDFNPTKDLEELERLLAKEPQLNFMKI